jgi:hypothetical protein
LPVTTPPSTLLTIVLARVGARHVEETTPDPRSERARRRLRQITLPMTFNPRKTSAAPTAYTIATAASDGVQLQRDVAAMHDRHAVLAVGHGVRAAGIEADDAAPTRSFAPSSITTPLREAVDDHAGDASFDPRKCKPLPRSASGRDLETHAYPGGSAWIPTASAVMSGNGVSSSTS